MDKGRFCLRFYEVLAFFCCRSILSCNGNAEGRKAKENRDSRRYRVWGGVRTRSRAAPPAGAAVKPVEKHGGGGYLPSEVLGKSHILSAADAKTKRRQWQREADGQACPRLSAVAPASAAGWARRWRRRSLQGEGAGDVDGRLGGAAGTG